jgi:hypothetical protein
MFRCGKHHSQEAHNLSPAKVTVVKISYNILTSLSFLRARCHIQFYYQLMHLMIKNTHSSHLKPTHVKNVCDA